MSLPMDPCHVPGFADSIRDEYSCTCFVVATLISSFVTSAQKTNIKSAQKVNIKSQYKNPKEISAQKTNINSTMQLSWSHSGGDFTLAFYPLYIFIGNI